MKTIIITGCAGLIGNHLSRHLLKKGYRIIGIDNLSGGYKDFIPKSKNFIFYKLSLEDKQRSADLFKKINKKYKPFAIYHLAAYAAEGLSPFIRHYNYTNNILSSVNIINACVEYGWKIIFTSSMAVYGENNPPFKESMLPSPVDPYGIAKYAIEMDIIQASHQFNLRYNIVRPHNVLGIYQNIWDIYRNVIGIFIKKTLDKKPMIIYGDGEQTRAFSDIKFYLDPLEKLLFNHDNEIFNIGADKYFTINDVAKIIEKIGKKYGFQPTKIYSEPRHEVKHAFCDHTKAKEFLDFFDNTDIEQLINEMFVWARSQPKRKQKFMDYEIQRDIYNYWKY